MGSNYRFMSEPGISHHRVLNDLRDKIECGLWIIASHGRNGQGLHKGTPDLSPALKAKRKFLKEGKLFRSGLLLPFSQLFVGRQPKLRTPLCRRRDLVFSGFGKHLRSNGSLALPHALQRTLDSFKGLASLF